MSLLHTSRMSPEAAYEALIRFSMPGSDGRSREPALRLAMHAAVPEGFRPDLLHLMRLNFPYQMGDGTDAGPEIEADVLLAPFCKHLGSNFFEFDPEVRRILLYNMILVYAEKDPDHIIRVSNLLRCYIEQHEHTAAVRDPLWRDYLEVQRWVVLGNVDPVDMARQLAAAIKDVVEKKFEIQAQFGVVALAVGLQLAGYPDFLLYYTVVQLAVAGELEKAERLVSLLSERKPVVVEGVELPPVAELKRLLATLHERVRDEEQTYSVEVLNFLTRLLEEAEPNYPLIDSQLPPMLHPLPGNLSKEFEALQFDLLQKRNEEYNRLAGEVPQIYFDPALSPEEKLDRLKPLLAPRLYPAGMSLDLSLAEKLAILKDEKHPQNVKMRLEYIHHYMQNELDRIPYDDANTWVSEQRARLEALLEAAKTNKALADLVEPVNQTLQQLRSKRDWLSDYVFNRAATRSLKKIWVLLIKENLIRINAGLLGEYRGGQYVDLVQETEAMRREYAVDCFDTAAEKLALATGLSLHEWYARPAERAVRDPAKPQAPVLNAERPLPVIQKDLKVGLIALCPSEYMLRFPEIEITDDRSLDPSPVDLDIQHQDAFGQLLAALNEALDLANRVRSTWEALKLETSAGASDLDIGYEIYQRYSSEDIGKWLTDQEDLVEHRFSDALDNLKKEERDYIWQLDDDTSELDDLRQEIKQHPVYRYTSNSKRINRLDAIIRTLDDLKTIRLEAVKQRRAFADKINALRSLLSSADIAVVHAELLHRELVEFREKLDARHPLDAQVADLLPGFSSFRELVLSSDLEKDFNETSARFANTKGAKEAYEQLRTAYERHFWERAVSIGQIYYGDDRYRDVIPEWQAGRQMYLLASAYTKYREASKLPFTRFEVISALIAETEEALDTRAAMLGRDDADSVDVQEKISDLRAQVRVYEAQNRDIIELSQRVEVLTDRIIPFAKRDYVRAYELFSEEEEADKAWLKARKGQYGETWRDAVCEEIDNQFKNVENASSEVVSAIRANLTVLKAEGWWNDPERERRFNDLLIAQFRSLQHRAPVNRPSVFGLALTQDQYKEWLDVLRARHSEQIEHSLARDEIAQVAAYYRISQAEQKENYEAQIRDLEKAINDEKGNPAYLGRPLLVDALLYRIDRHIQANNSVDEEITRDMLVQLGRMREYRHQLIILGRDDLSMLWEYRAASWRAFLERRISHAFKQLDDLDNLIRRIDLDRAPHWLAYRCRETHDLFLDRDSTNGLPRLILAFINEELGRFIQSGLSPQYGGIEELVGVMEYALILIRSGDNLHQLRAQRAIEILNPQITQIAVYLEDLILYIVGELLPNDLVQAADRIDALTAQLQAIVDGLSDRAIAAELDDPGVSARYAELYEQAQTVNGYIKAALIEFRKAIYELQSLITAGGGRINIGRMWDFGPVSYARDQVQHNCSQAQVRVKINPRPIRSLIEIDDLVDGLKHYLVRSDADIEQNAAETNNIAQYSLVELLEYIPPQLNSRRGEPCPFARYSRAHAAIAAVGERVSLIQKLLADYRHLFGSEPLRFVLPDDFLVTRLRIPVRDPNGELVDQLRGLAQHQSFIPWLNQRAQRWQRWLEELSLRYDRMFEQQTRADGWLHYLQEIAYRIAGDESLPDVDNFWDPMYYDALVDPRFTPHTYPDVPYSELPNLVLQYRQSVEELGRVIEKTPDNIFPLDLVDCFRELTWPREPITNALTRASNEDLIAEVGRNIRALRERCDKLQDQIEKILVYTDRWIVLVEEAIYYVNDAIRQEEKRGRRADRDKIETYNAQRYEYERILKLLQGQALD